MLFSIIALVLANLEVTKHAYHHLLETELGVHINNFRLAMTFEQWVNDALMAVFFFVVGLEIKREIIAGELSTVKHAMLPVAAAVGGMVVPAVIYIWINAGTEFSGGWGIPMATDIAFAIGILSLLGKKVPISLKIFLTALAIVDDLGAILVIAIFYTSTIDFLMLGAGLAVLCLMFWMNWRGIKPSLIYLVPGILVWYFFLNSGVYSTIAGVLAAMAIPTKPRFTKKYFLYKTKYFLEEFRFTDKKGIEVLSNPEQLEVLNKVHYVANGTISPSQKLEHILNPWVMFLVMPVFAFTNAGVELDSFADLHVLGTTQGMGIFLGLVLGKPVGIFLFCWLTIKSKLAVLPDHTTWNMLLGVACLGGIGFTMSIFIDNLAFAGTEWVDTGKIAVLIASVTAAVFGALVINLMVKKDHVTHLNANDA